jgi:diguanylate cyclase (GGDEF)-like protein
MDLFRQAGDRSTETDESIDGLMNRSLVERHIERLGGFGFQGLDFDEALEERFEQDTARERSHRLWLEGLLAILFLNGCLMVDYVLVKDQMLETTLKRTMVVTPLALVVNFMMRMDLRRWIREGSVALAMAVICGINLYVERGSTAATAMMGLMSVVITTLFANMVMRLRFAYTTASTVLMLLAGIWFACEASGLTWSEKIIGASMMVLGVAMTLVAAYGLERQERIGYLLYINSQLQSAELHRLSNLDKLTGLPNRRAFEERYETLWAEGMRAGTALSAIVIDIDHFKVVNDVYGHLYGDEVLRHVAGLLPQLLRVQSDLAARFGGEEFVILLPNTQMERAAALAERVRSLVETAGPPAPEMVNGGETLWVTVSCGVSTCVPDARTGSERLLTTADHALYEAKRNGRNRVEMLSCEPGAATGPVGAGRAMQLLERMGVGRAGGRGAGRRIG